MYSVPLFEVKNLAKLVCDFMYKEMNLAIKCMFDQEYKIIENSYEDLGYYSRFHLKERAQCKIIDIFFIILNHPDVYEPVQLSISTIQQLRDLVNSLLISYMEMHNYFIDHERQPDLLVSFLNNVNKSVGTSVSEIETLCDRLVYSSDVTEESFVIAAACARGIKLYVEKIGCMFTSNGLNKFSRLNRNNKFGKLSAYNDLCVSRGIFGIDRVKVELDVLNIDRDVYLEKFKECCKLVFKKYKDFLSVEIQRRCGCSLERIRNCISQELAANPGKKIFPERAVFVCAGKVMLLSSNTEYEQYVDLKQEDFENTNKHDSPSSSEKVCFSGVNQGASNNVDQQLLNKVEKEKEKYESEIAEEGDIPSTVSSSDQESGKVKRWLTIYNNVAWLTYRAMYGNLKIISEKMYTESCKVGSNSGGSYCADFDSQHRGLIVLINAACQLLGSCSLIKPLHIAEPCVNRIREQAYEVLDDYVEIHNSHIKSQGVKLSGKCLSSSSKELLNKVQDAKRFCNRLISTSDFISRNFMLLATLISMVELFLNQMQSTIMINNERKQQALINGQPSNSSTGIIRNSIVDWRAHDSVNITGFDIESFFRILKNCMDIHGLEKSYNDFFLKDLEKKRECSFEKLLLSLADASRVTYGGTVFDDGNTQVFVSEGKVKCVKCSRKSVSSEVESYHRKREMSKQQFNQTVLPVGETDSNIGEENGTASTSGIVSAKQSSSDVYVVEEEVENPRKKFAIDQKSKIPSVNGSNIDQDRQGILSVNETNSEIRGDCADSSIQSVSPVKETSDKIGTENYPAGPSYGGITQQSYNQGVFSYAEGMGSGMSQYDYSFAGPSYGGIAQQSYNQGVFSSVEGMGSGMNQCDYSFAGPSYGGIAQQSYNQDVFSSLEGIGSGMDQCNYGFTDYSNNGVDQQCNQVIFPVRADSRTNQDACINDTSDDPSVSSVVNPLFCVGEVNSIEQKSFTQL